MVGVSRELVLIHELSDEMHLDGYSTIRVKDIKRYRTLDDYDYFANRALRLRKQTPRPLRNISLSGFPSLIRSLRSRFPLFVIHEEAVDDQICFIGKASKMTKRSIILKEMDPGAKWEGMRNHRLRNITRIGFGGNYEQALWMVFKAERRGHTSASKPN